MFNALSKLTLAVVLLLGQSGNVVTGEGYGEIVDGHVTAARDFAISRARWDALIKTANIKVQADTLVVDTALASQIILTQVEGVVSVHKVLAEEQRGNTYWVR